MLTVYIVIAWTQYEGETFLGVFSCPILAKKCQSDNIKYFDGVEITEDFVNIPIDKKPRKRKIGV